jgi:hypothetical protein
MIREAIGLLLVNCFVHYSWQGQGGGNAGFLNACHIKIIDQTLIFKLSFSVFKLLT